MRYTSSDMLESSARRALLLAVLVFGVFLVRPLLSRCLRARDARRDPAAWAENRANGRFAVLLPGLYGTRYYDESAYAARVHQVLLHGVPYGPYWREHRRLKDWYYELIPNYVLAGFAALCGGDLNVAWLLVVAVVAGGWAALWFWIFSAWCGRDSIAAVLALFLSLFPDFNVWLLDINLDAGLSAWRWSSVFVQRGAVLLPLTHRLYSQHLSFLAVCLLLAALWRLAVEQRLRPVASLALGLAFSSLVLVHSFEYALAMSVVALLPFAAEAFGLRAVRRNLWLCLAAALVGTAVYLAFQFSTSTELGKLVPALPAAPGGRRFHPMTVVHLAIAAWAWMRARREASTARSAVWLVLGAAQAGAFLWRNMELLIGRDVEFFHMIPMSGVLGSAAIFLAFSESLARMKRWRRSTTLGAVAVLIAVALGREAAGAAASYRMLGLPRDIEAGCAWLSKNAPLDGLLLSPSLEVNMLAALYTPVKVETMPLDAPVQFVFSREQHLLRLARLLKTLRIDPDRFAAARWLTPASRRPLEDEAARAIVHEGRAITPELLEALVWFRGDFTATEKSVLAGRRRLKELYASAQPIAPPFYVWVNAHDRPLLLESPERWAGRPVFESGSVALYSIP